MAAYNGYTIPPNIAFDMTRPPYESYVKDVTGGGGGGGGGGGIIMSPTSPSTPAQASQPQQNQISTPAAGVPVTTPAGPSTPVQAPAQPAPSTPGSKTEALPARGQVSGPLMPPQSVPIAYAGGQTLGTNPNIGNQPVTAGTGAASVGNFRGAFSEGDRGAVTRGVQANELSSQRLNEMISGNSQYIRNARLAAAERASDSGMLMSSVAAGASQRAAIDAAQPFAMQEAEAYGRAASENMAAQNADNLADQGQFRDMAARDIALRAQMEDASLGRQFQSGMASNEQAWRSGESYLDRQFQQGENNANRNFQSSERAAAENFQSGQSAYDRMWRSGEAAADRYQQTYERIGSQDFQQGMAREEQGWRSGEAALDRTQNAEQAALNRAESRYSSYFSTVANREAHTAQVLNGIYSNPNLTPAQQQAAVANANAVLKSIYDGYSTVMADGIPPIFFNPYPMQFQQP